MCDLLKKSALAYQALSEYEYTLTCGKKGELTHIVLRFPIGAYHHLSGFQYARIATLREKKNCTRYHSLRQSFLCSANG